MGTGALRCEKLKFCTQRQQGGIWELFVGRGSMSNSDDERAHSSYRLKEHSTFEFDLDSGLFKLFATFKVLGEPAPCIYRFIEKSARSQRNRLVCKD